MVQFGEAVRRAPRRVGIVGDHRLRNVVQSGPSAFPVLELGRGWLVYGPSGCPPVRVHMVGSRWSSGVRGAAEGLAACQVHVPVSPNRSMPNDALQPTAFGRG